MSQAGMINTSSGPVPPTVATTYVTDSGNAVPEANILNVLADDTNIDNNNGIRTIGSGNTVTVQLTNRITGSIQTTDATPTTLVSLSLGATPGAYIVQGNIIAYNVTDSAGGAYTFEGAAITDGATATELGSEVKNVFESAAMSTSDFNFIISGNTATVQVIGIAAKTIDWSCLFIYRFVG